MASVEIQKKSNHAKERTKENNVKEKTGENAVLKQEIGKRYPPKAHLPPSFPIVRKHSQPFPTQETKNSPLQAQVVLSDPMINCHDSQVAQHLSVSPTRQPHFHYSHVFSLCQMPACCSIAKSCVSLHPHLITNPSDDTDFPRPRAGPRRYWWRCPHRSSEIPFL